MTARLRELAERWRMQSGSMASAAYEACANELLSILDAEGDGGADDPVAVIGRDWQLLYVGADPIASIVKRHGLRIGSNLYPHPTRSGGVSDADVEAACRAYIAADRFLLDGAVDSMREPMRAALEHFAKGEHHER